MKKLEKPKIIQKDIIDACIYNVRKQPTLTNIKNSTTCIIRESKKYDEWGQKGKLWKIPVCLTLDGGATKEDMVWIYEQKFVGGHGRKYYDKIMGIPPFSRCPFCGVRRVSTLDHYLAKSKYPVFAITPYNLVASCFECNKKKLDLIIKKREEELFHPYYDDFDDEIWLRARVSFDEEIIFEFYTDRPDRWTEEKYNRVKNHFEKLGLDDLYISHAAEEFAECKDNIKRLYKIGGEDLVRKELLNRIKEHRNNMKNTWRAALYEGLLNSSDFLNIFCGINGDYES